MKRAVAVLAIATLSASLITTPAAAAPTSAINWKPCADVPTVDCATLTVPIDWANPSRGTFELALARRKATGPNRIGSVLVNPGGPGGSGVEWVKAESPMSPQVAERFDFIGFDPRGVGESHPVMCDMDIAFEEYPQNPQNQAEFEQLVDHNRRYGESCARLTGPLINFVDTLSVARDVDAIRAALGEAKLTYYGVSYGTLIGQQYAELFPHRVRALVLDSNMDHSMRTAFQFFQTEARAFQEGFDEFVAWNARTPGSPLAGQDARAVFHAVWDRAERGELKWPGSDRPFTTLDLQGVMFGPQYGPDWPSMAEILQFLLTMPASDGFTAGEVHDPFQAVFCLDWRLPIHNYYELDAYRRISAATVARDVRFSPLGLAASTACQGWPIRTTNPQHDLRWRGAPPILMLNSRFDPATPYEWAATAARQSGAVLLSYDGWGHGTYFKNSDCVVSAVDNYLINRQVPPRGKHCAAVEPGLRQLIGTTSRIAGPWGF